MSRSPAFFKTKPAPRSYIFNAQVEKLRPQLRYKFKNPDKPTCTPEWQQKADESYKRISKKYAPKYSVRRDS